MRQRRLSASRQRLSRLPWARRPLELWCAWTAMLVGSFFSGNVRLDPGKVSSGALMSGALALLLEVGARREGALGERAGALPALLRVATPLALPCAITSASVWICADTEVFSALAASLSAFPALALPLALADWVDLAGVLELSLSTGASFAFAVFPTSAVFLDASAFTLLPAPVLAAALLDAGALPLACLLVARSATRSTRAS